MQAKGEQALDRSVAQFFFEIGYAACWADAFIQNDQKPPFHLTDAIIERAWQTSYESYEEPAEFDAKLAIANAAPELLEALERIEAISAPGQEMSLSVAIDALCDCWNAARASRAKGLPS